jgi:hypothetical protein
LLRRLSRYDWEEVKPIQAQSSLEKSELEAKVQLLESQLAEVREDARKMAQALKEHGISTPIEQPSKDNPSPSEKKKPTPYQ